MSDNVKINKHKVFKNATEQADWLNKKFGFWSGLRCHRPASHITHLAVFGGKMNKNVGNMANIWYLEKRIDLYDEDYLDLFKEFAKKFGYKNIELHESG